jgi:putative pyruvate formate lyase activating enzyme
MSAVPAYRLLHQRGELARRAREAARHLSDCALCPRQCRVNRVAAADGHCRTGRHAIVSSCHPHHGEEAPLSGRRGSGTIFFASCSLGCVFCQNWSTSHLRDGSPVTDRQLGALMLELQALGCHNINLVTPSHVVPQILAAVVCAADRGLKIPLVYNTGGYDGPASLALLDGVVDVYMPDIKTLDRETAGRVLLAADYPDVVRDAVREMHRQVGDLVLDETGVAVRGLLVRHLVMPEGLATTREVMRFLAREISPATYVNVMGQYRPCGDAFRYAGLDRPVTADEHNDAREACREEGLWRVDGETGVQVLRAQRR